MNVLKNQNFCVGFAEWLFPRTIAVYLYIYVYIYIPHNNTYEVPAEGLLNVVEQACVAASIRRIVNFARGR